MISRTSVLHFELEEKNASNHDALEEALHHVGEMGRYQKCLFAAMLPIGFFTAFVYFAQMFVTATPQRHWCKVPELAHLDLELRRNLSAPGAILGDDWDRCSTFITNWTHVLETLTPPDSNTRTEPCKHGWEFELGDIPYHTVVSERGWVCENAKLVPSAQSLFFVGSLVGCLLFGWLADRFGRVPAVIGSNLAGCIGGVASTFTTGFWDFAVSRFLVGMAYDSILMMLYILVLEYVGPRHRTWVANVSLGVFFGTGCIILPWIALGVGNWRVLLWVTSLPMLIVVTGPCLLPESASWLSSQGRCEDAVKVLKRFERVNNSKIPPYAIDKFIMTSHQADNKDDNFKALLKSPPLRIVFILSVIIFMACGLAFDGLVRMSESLGLDFFVTFTLTSATEIPSVILLTLILDRWGRRMLTCGSLMMSGLLAIFAAFVPKGIPQASLAIISRFFINMGTCAMTQWTAEVLPTPVRASGSSFIHMSGFAAALLSPYVVFLAHVWRPFPMIVFGTVSTIAAVIGAMLPETKGRPMPQTILDGEMLYKQNSILARSQRRQEKTVKMHELKHLSARKNPVAP